MTSSQCLKPHGLRCPLSIDKISSTNPRVIEDMRARQLCVDVRHCVFYETCATYGLNVDRVFQEGELTEIEHWCQSWGPKGTDTIPLF